MNKDEQSHTPMATGKQEQHNLVPVNEWKDFRLGMIYGLLLAYVLFVLITLVLS